MTSLAQTEVFRDYQLLANNFPSFLIFREDDFPFEKYIHHLLPFYFSIHVLCKWGSQLHYFLNILQCSFCSNLKGIRTEMNRQEDPSLPVFLFCREINNFTKKFLCNFPGPDWTGWAQGRWWWPSLAAAVNLWVLQEGPGRTRRREEAGLMQSPDRRTARTAVSSGVVLGISQIHCVGL